MQQRSPTDILKMEERPLHIFKAGLVNTTRVEPNFARRCTLRGQWLTERPIGFIPQPYRHSVRQQEELQPGLKVEDEEENCVYS